MTTFADLVNFIAIFFGVCSVIVWYCLYRFQKNIKEKSAQR